jgi:tetratricopeptide (TPR) repeat protein
MFEALLDAGAALVAMERSDEALIWLERATKARPDSALAYTKIGQAEEQLGHRAEAEAGYRRALQLRPELAVAREGIARLAGAQRR